MAHNSPELWLAHQYDCTMFPHDMNYYKAPQISSICLTISAPGVVCLGYVWDIASSIQYIFLTRAALIFAWYLILKITLDAPLQIMQWRVLPSNSVHNILLHYKDSPSLQLYSIQSSIIHLPLWIPIFWQSSLYPNRGIRHLVPPHLSMPAPLLSLSLRTACHHLWSPFTMMICIHSTMTMRLLAMAWNLTKSLMFQWGIWYMDMWIECPDHSPFN